jgi:hypothetical protein
LLMVGTRTCSIRARSLIESGSCSTRARIAIWLCDVPAACTGAASATSLQHLAQAVDAVGGSADGHVAVGHGPLQLRRGSGGPMKARSACDGTRERSRVVPA